MFVYHWRDYNIAIFYRVTPPSFLFLKTFKAEEVAAVIGVNRVLQPVSVARSIEASEFIHTRLPMIARVKNLIA
jgi:hypothetical protein